jgi:DNA-binding response OmpR family regulator
MSMKVLLLEDEEALADTILLSLKKLGYDCHHAKTLKEGREQLKNHRFSLMILDRNLPDGEGTRLLKDPNRGDAMSLILSAKASVAERVEGLNYGADDYLPKPFSYSELSARLKALERRMPAVSSQGIASGGRMWVSDESTLSLTTPKGKIVLTPLEFKFITYLIARKNTIVSKNRLLQEVWGFTLLPKTRTVDYVITNLRKRIEEEPDHPKHLLTVRGAGVKFVSE